MSKSLQLDLSDLDSAERENADAMVPPNERWVIDQSCRQVVLLWYGSSVFWLLFGSLLALVASIKMHTPGFLADSVWLTFGRVRPVHLNTMIYGWASDFRYATCRRGSQLSVPGS